MSKKQIIELVGKDTVLELHCIIDSVMDYRTVIPQLRDGEYINYKVSFFYEEHKVIFKHDTLSGFLEDFQIYELTEIRDIKEQYTNIYEEKYIDPKNK